MKIAEYYENLIYMRKHYWMLLLGLGLLSSCEKVKDLSDDANVTQFDVISHTPEDAKIGRVTFDDYAVHVDVLPQDNLFPLTLQTQMRVSSTTDAVLGGYGGKKEKGSHNSELTFSKGDDMVIFQLIAESGVPHFYTVSLLPINTGADIVNLDILHEGKTSFSVSVDPWAKDIEFSLPEAEFPLTISLINIALSPGASMENYTEGDELTFDKMESTHKINVVSEDGNITREWTVSFKLPQIANSDFEQWGSGYDVNQGNITIAPLPEKGKGWATANNSYIQGTLPIDYKGGKAAQMKTGVQKVPIFDHDLIAAGTLYTGYFQLKLDFENPRSMTNFGIPFNVRIKSVEFDAQYIAGPQLQQSIKNDKGKYRVQNIDGYDEGQAWVEILRWTGEGELHYEGKPLNGLEVLGRKELLFDGANKKYHQWARYSLPVEYTDTQKTPTHIAIVFSSSKGGDIFKGAPGSILNVDNVELIYK